MFSGMGKKLRRAISKGKLDTPTYAALTYSLTCLRYGRDYYINDARRASGSRKKSTPDSPTSPCPSGAPPKEVSGHTFTETKSEEQQKYEQSVPHNDNYIMEKFFKESELKQAKKKVGSFGMGVLQRSMSLRSLRGGTNCNTVFSSPESISNKSSNFHHSTANGRLKVDDNDDSFSVLSLDRNTYEERERSRKCLEKKSLFASEVQLSADVLAQFEAKSLFAELKRDSFRARNGTTNFALNPIFDEAIVSPPPSAQVPDYSSPNTISIVNDDSQQMNNGDCTPFPWSQLQLTEEGGRNNCVETNFESLSAINKRRLTNFKAKDFGDDLY